MKISSESKVNEPAFSKLKSYFSLVKMFSSYKLAVKASFVYVISAYTKVSYECFTLRIEREACTLICYLWCNADGHRSRSRLEEPKAWLYGEKHCMH